MELITIQEAAKKAELSDRTLRRAIADGILILQPKLHPNSPIMIANDELTRYIASRQVSTSDVQAPDETQTEERITALEQEVTQLSETLQREQVLNIQKDQEVDDLRKRVISLETALQEITRVTSHQEAQGEDSPIAELPRHTVSSNVQASTKRTRAPKQQDEPFKMADFSKAWEDEYTCEAVQKDIKAVWILKPYTATGTNGTMYHVSVCDWNPTKNTRKIPDEMSQRGNTLKNALDQAAREAMLIAGWIELEGQTDKGRAIYMKPVD